MVRVRAQAGEMRDAEHQLLIKRQEATRSRERDVLLIGACIAGLSISTRVAIAWAWPGCEGAASLRLSPLAGLTSWLRRTPAWAVM